MTQFLIYFFANSRDDDILKENMCASGTLLTKRPDIYDDACYTRHNQQYAPETCVHECVCTVEKLFA